MKPLLWAVGLSALTAWPIAAQSLQVHKTVDWIRPMAEPLLLNPYSGWINAVAFEADGARIVADTDKTLYPLDLSLKEAGKAISGHRGMGDKSWFSADGTKVYVASWVTTTTTDNGKRRTTQAGELTVVDRAKQKIDPLAPLKKEVASFAASSDGARLALGFEDGSFQILDGASGKPLLGPVQAFLGLKVGKERIATVTAVALTPDGRRLALGDMECKLRFFDAATGKAEGKPVPGHSSLIEVMAFASDGKRLITATQDGGLYLLDATTGRALGERLHIGDKVTAMALSPDGTRLVTGHFSGTVRLWSFAKGE